MKSVVFELSSEKLVNMGKCPYKQVFNSDVQEQFLMSPLANLMDKDPAVRNENRIATHMQEHFWYKLSTSWILVILWDCKSMITCNYYSLGFKN